MKLIGKLVKDTKTVKAAVAEKRDDKADYRDLLEECFLKLCSDLDIPVPLWLKKNSKEFGAYRFTFFTADQFLERIDFDRFEMRLEPD
ncbi:MAG: hypothetical protein N2484_07850 [Clostridia bacterium]|nr:hypothetical protein [Clostridia bacterium]